MKLSQNVLDPAVFVLMSYSLALGAVAVHAVLYGLVAGLADRPAGHLDRQTRLCAPLDASLQLPALCIHCREATDTHKTIQMIFILQGRSNMFKGTCCWCRVG